MEAVFRFQAESRDMNLCGHEFVEKVDLKRSVFFFNEGLNMD